MIQKNIPLSGFSTFGVGGNADFFLKIEKKEDLLHASSFCKTNSIPFFCLGGGSNLVFSDDGMRGLVLQFANKNISLQDETLLAESGVRMTELYLFAKKRDLDFVLLSTIPGTLGGALAGNAGLLGVEMKDIVFSVELFDWETEEFFWVSLDFLHCEYRKTIFHDIAFRKKYTIWSMQMRLPFQSEEESNAKLKEYMTMRKQKQPWGKTGGSFFRNPPEGSAGMFLEKAGFKGKHFGGAFFSEKHANFLMSDGTATQLDIITLAQNAKQLVFEQFGVVLNNEVKILDEWGNEVVLL